MDETPNLRLPYIIAAQAQKHVTHNEAIRALDALVHLTVLDRDLASPPVSPADGDRYIPAAGASGAWSGQAGTIAAFQDGGWAFLGPREGWLAWVADEDVIVAWSGTAWVAASGGGGGGGGSVSLNPATGGLLGINTVADATNRLAVKSDAALFSHDDVTPGSGDLRQVLNKAAAARTVSQLYQTGFSGRAETGLTGDDDFHVRVSPDGATWHDAIVVDRTTGAVAFPNTTIGSGAGGGAPAAPQGRLTLSSGVPAMAATVAGATAVHYTPCRGRHVPLFDGGSWSMTDIGGQLSQATTDTTKSPAAVVANSNYDLFVWIDGGTSRCTRGPAWTSDTARGAGAGTTELEYVAGFQVNKHAITNGPAANRGTYVGTIRTNAAAQVDFILGGLGTGGLAAVLGVWNAYNRVETAVQVFNSTVSWTYASNPSVWRAQNASNSMRVSFVSGLQEDAFSARNTCISTSAITNQLSGVGFDSASTPSGIIAAAGIPSGGIGTTAMAEYTAKTLGWHFCQSLERNQAAGSTTTFYGGNAGLTQSGLSFTFPM